MNKKLYRSRRLRTISGVAGGLADFFDVDVSLIRLLWVLGTIFTGIFPGLFLYLIAAIIIPEEDGTFVEHEAEAESYGPDTEVFSSSERPHDSRKGALIVGGFLVIVGGLLLLQRVFPVFVRWNYLWPALLILLGVAIVAGSFNKK